MPRVALITGSSGGIGQALGVAFAAAGYRVLSLDREGEGSDDFISCDLGRLAGDAVYRDQALTEIRRRLGNDALHVLINNAALQVVEDAATLPIAAWNQVMAVNLTAPFILVQGLLPELRANAGSVINICSIHAGLTKLGFSAYATSKAALAGLTRALAVDLGGRIRVNGIAPAAIATPMLKAGFNGNPAGYEKLSAFHPSGEIGQPEEVARLAVFLAAEGLPFLNGAIVNLDGGIAARLHDPD